MLTPGSTHTISNYKETVIPSVVHEGTRCSSNILGSGNPFVTDVRQDGDSVTFTVNGKFEECMVDLDMDLDFLGSWEKV